jgi:hypothetical protein
LLLLSDKFTRVLEAAADAKDTVQVVVPAAANVEGEQVNPDKPVGATRLMGAERVTPLSDARTLAVWLEVTDPAVTLKVALLDPFPITTEEGVTRGALSSERLTVVAPEEDLSRETVQVALWLLLRLPGAQVRFVSTDTAGATRFSVVLWVPPLNAAEMVTVSLDGTPTTVMPNCTPLWPATTVTVPGTLTLKLLDEMDTPAFVAAGAVKATVQVPLAAALKLVGEHTIELSELEAGATRFSCAVRVTPLSEAVTVAVWLEAIEPAVTAKDPLLAPLPIATEPGVPSAALSSVNVTVTPLAEDLVRVTVQFAL